MWIVPSSIRSRFAAESDCSTSGSISALSTSESEPSLLLMLSGMPQLRLFSSNVWRSRAWSQRLFGAAISSSSRQSNFTDWWTASLRGSRANHTRPPASASPWKMSDGYGLKSSTSSVEYDRRYSIWKTSGVSFQADWKAAYLAGLIDGDGYVGIWKRTKSGKAYYGPTVQMGMAEKARPLLAEFQATFGGSLNQVRKQSERWAAAWTWALFGENARALLRRVGPFLHLKEQQVRLALLEEITERDYLKIKNLNKKGPSTGPTSTDSENPSLCILKDGRWMVRIQDLFGEQWEPFSGRWPASGLMRAGECYLLPPLVLPTNASGCSSWPTATAQDSEAAGAGLENRGPTLTVAIKQWATPNAGDSLRGQKDREDRAEGMHLSMEASRWTTPDAAVLNDGQTEEERAKRRARELAKGYNGNGGGEPLAYVVRTWPTPNSRDHKGEDLESREGGSSLSHVVQTGERSHYSRPDQEAPSGETSSQPTHGSPQRLRLNPAFVCWLMGMPHPFWTRAEQTSFGAQATRSWRRKVRRHLSYLLGG